MRSRPLKLRRLSYLEKVFFLGLLIDPDTTKTFTEGSFFGLEKWKEANEGAANEPLFSGK